MLLRQPSKFFHNLVQHSNLKQLVSNTFEARVALHNSIISRLQSCYTNNESQLLKANQLLGVNQLTTRNLIYGNSTLTKYDSTFIQCKSYAPNEHIMNLLYQQMDSQIKSKLHHLPSMQIDNKLSRFVYPSKCQDADLMNIELNESFVCMYILKIYSNVCLMTLLSIQWCLFLEISGN